MRELMLLLAAAVIALVYQGNILPIMDRKAKINVYVSAAYQVREVTKAANSYITAHYGILNGAAAGAPLVVTVPMLVADKRLTPSFVDRNVFRQTHAVIIRRVQDQVLEAVVATCGGAPIDDTALNTIAPFASADIGYVGIIPSYQVVQAAGACPAAAGQCITGPGGEIRANIADFANASCPLQAGHFANLLTYEPGSNLASQVLHRNSVPGDLTAELNTMRTNQIMAEGTDIVLKSAGGKTRYLSEALPTRQIAYDGTIINKPSCSGTTAPVLDLIPMGLSDSGRGYPVIRWDINKDDAGPTWTVRVSVWTQNSTGTGIERIAVTPEFGAVVALSYCALV